MKWVLQKFGWLALLFTTFLGLLFVPLDWLDKKNALKAWGQLFTVGNREMLWIAFSILCLARLGYISLRTAINDEHWPPVYEKLQFALGALFKKDRRLAELVKLEDFATTKAVKNALVAKKLLVSCDFERVDSLPFPPQMSAQDWMIRSVDYIFELQNKRSVLRSKALQTERAASRQDDETESVILNAAKEMFEKSKPQWDMYEQGCIFHDEAARNLWHELRCLTDALNEINPKIEATLKHSVSEVRSVYVDEDTSLQFLNDLRDKIKT